VKITQTRRELAAQRELNAAFRTEMTQRYSLDEIERIARERLGMNKPDASQIITIHVPKQSHTVLNNEEDASENEYNFFTIMINFVSDSFKKLTGKP
jgi:hypothetical protein